MSSEVRQRYVRLEARARRAVGDGAVHPDLCPKLTLHGVAFAIPPRDIRVLPEFSAAGVTMSIVGLDRWPEADRVLALATSEGEDVCPACGRPRIASVEVDLDRSRDFLSASFGLAAELLARQYEVSDQEKAELLAFPLDRAPVWLTQLLHWCRGLAMESVP
jgi:hypothetical protein